MPDTAPAIGEEVSLTPEQQAQYEQLSQPRPNEVDPIRDFNSQQLAELSVKDPSFNVVEAFRQHPDRSPATVQKVADAFDTVTKRGFKLADLPNPITAVPKAVYEFGKGALKQAWNYANAAGAAVAGAAYGGEAENEMLKDAQQRVAENFSGTEQAVTGLSNQIQGAGRKAVNLVTGGAKTPEDRVKNLWDAVGRGEVSEDISKGHGAFMSAAGGNVIKELETAGKPVRPEEVNTLAAGDPFTFWAFGKALQGAGKVGSAVAEKIPGVQAITSALPEVVAKAGGKVIQAAGSTTEGAGKVAAVTGGLVKTAGPILEAAHGLISGDFTRAAAGGLGEYYGGSALRWLGQQAPKVAKGVKDFGKQVGGEAAITSDYAQAGRDVLQALPGAAGEVAKGAAIDLGVAAVSSETPEQTQNALGMGTAFGALGGAGRTIGHVVSGQIIAPRVWGSNTPVASSGNFPALNAAHSKAYASATRGVQTRINAVRQFVKTAAPGTDVFLSSDPAVLEKSLIDSGVNPQTAKTWSAQEGFFTTDLPGKDGQPHRVVVVTNPDAAPHEAFHAFQDVLGEEGNRAIDEIVKKDYGDRWEEEGQRYASRLGVTGADWRSGLLDLTGWGRSEAIDKLTTSLENQMVSEGHTADPEFVKQRVEGEWNKLREQAKANNPTATPAGIEAAIWRDVLSPDEAKDTADRYIAREIAAENFDAIFKAQGPELAESTSLIGQLARVVSRAMSALGVNPLADRQTEIGRIEPKAATVKAVRNAAVESKPVTPTGAKPEVSAPSMPPKAEQESQKIRSGRPKTLSRCRIARKPLALLLTLSTVSRPSK